MKIRIKGDTLRLRLTQSEIEQLAQTGAVVSKIGFSKSTELSYGLKTDANTESVAALFEGKSITVFVPTDLCKKWVSTEQVGFEANQTISSDRELFILVEKDFHCMVPRTNEDESDHYPNPLAQQS